MANKPPVPPAVAGTVPGQPPRRRLKVDDDPFGAVGDYAGPFLVKSAVEISAGYDCNPGRLEPAERGLPHWVVAPELLAVSNWDRHALVADLRGSFTGYGGSLPANDRRRHQFPRRPISTVRISPAMSTAGSTSPGIPTSPRSCGCTPRPTIPAARTSRPGLREYPVCTTLGVDHRRRPALQPPAGLGRRHRRPHRLSAEQADRRHHDQQRRPQLQPVWRDRARLLRGDARR